MDAVGPADTGVVPTQLWVTLAQQDVDLAVDALWLHNTTGIEERSAGEASIELRAGFEDRSDADLAAKGVAQRVPSAHLVVRSIRDDGYLDVWRDTAEPITIGRVTLCPSWIGDPPEEIGSQINLSLDPGRAFGLGNHPTTRHLIEALEHTVAGGERVLDVGCGSGVLAIVALRLGATEALGVDIDPEALRASRDNATRNQVEDRLRLSAGPLAPRSRQVSAAAQDLAPYEIVVANIGAAALIALAPVIGSWCGSGTTLMLSGVLDEQAEAVRDAYTEGHNTWTTITERSTDGWTSLILTATPAGLTD